MNKADCRILTEDRMMNNDTWETGLNNNDLIIGPSGAGKTRGYVLPNILQCNESMIIADTKGILKDKVGHVLQKEGYRVFNIDFTDLPASSCGYNPLDYVRYNEERGCYCEQDILTMAAALVPVEDSREPFWEKAARMYLECLIGYVLECLPDQEHTLESVVRLFMEFGSGGIDRLFSELSMINPDSFAVKRYKMFCSLESADRTHACVLGFLAEKLSPLSFDGTKELFQRPDRIRFECLGRRKIAVFLTISDTDRSLDRLINLFYTQALHTLCESADRDYEEHRLPVPVRFLLDDFAANVCIPDFDKIIAVIRSREIYVSILLQSLSQLESLYGHAKAMTIINNCDNFLYLGGQDVETARYVSFKANKPVSTILQMDLDKVWLFTRGLAPRLSGKYDLRRHEKYRELEECKEAAGSPAGKEMDPMIVK